MTQKGVFDFHIAESKPAMAFTAELESILRSADWSTTPV
ncbi:hypothetical protein HK44_015360 [Pseudomonas fluorescens HK44]|uniref:Uncharacterized protein n=1 Tax=Pseudomonas fluorescens HK44 TaxID=1042209 RepID=A0A010SGI2_PSEFL|nr:hypothetical protein HK44_015360 [Pseudomonas fluorescens HK44]